MNEFDDLENQLRSLSPGPLPEDIRLRLARPPQGRAGERLGKTKGLWCGAAALAAAACAVLLWWPSTNPPSESAPLSIYHQESTLIAAKAMGYVERDGRMWSLEEQQWQDEELAFCSNSPVTVHATRERVELVYQPVTFD